MMRYNYRQGFRSKCKPNVDYLPVIEVSFSEEFKILGCWLSKFKYPRIGNEQLHIKFAEGSGDIVRHLCGCNRCFNPLHVVRGSDIENAKDETEMQVFGISIMRQDIIVVCEGLTPNEEFLILQAKVTRLWNKSASDVNQYLRECFRVYKERELSEDCNDRLPYLRELLLSIIKNVVIKEDRQ
jgi:hypothetical protein